MPYLVDTNLLLRRAQPHHPLNAVVRKATEYLRDQGEQLYITPQNLVEYWNVATRPENLNGLGMSPIEAGQEVDRLEIFFGLLPETPEIYPRWRELVRHHAVSGRQVHDARLVACMLVHDVFRLLSFNFSDFTRYSEITVVDPALVAPPPLAEGSL
ncbi:MAG TPA: PIN domain-containing protein [Armatimonadota bacterium]|nr:PIN domain-containing protein [Armatimonadota bacterium]